MTTKICPECGSDVVGLFHSTNSKICYDCGHEYPWNLEPGQKPLLAPNRAAPRVEWPADDKRIDIIGQNGPTGEHYADVQ